MPCGCHRFNAFDGSGGLGIHGGRPGAHGREACHNREGEDGRHSRELEEMHHLRCQCNVSTRVERFMEPCLLLLLSEAPSHGYDLISRLVEFGFSRDQDPGMVYRTLRRLEEQGMIRSNWAVAGAGPARREYVITDEGREYLRAWAETIRNNIETLSLFLERFRKIDSSPTQSERRQN